MGCTTLDNAQTHEGFTAYDMANPLPAPVSTSCPAGWVQVGEDGADIGGCGLQSCGERYGTTSPAECAENCAARDDCRGFNWAPMGGDRNHEAMTVCTMYNADAPTSTWYGSAGYVQIFCKPEAAPVQYHILGYGQANCAEGKRVDTYAECEAAHRALGLEINPVWSGNYDRIPGLCSTRERDWGGGHHMHFNSLAVGIVRSDLSPVCRV